MYRGLSVGVLIPVLNEEAHIRTVLDRIPIQIVDEVVVIDDGSTDASATICRQSGATVLVMGRTVGVGAALRRGYRYTAERGYDATVVMAGNNKDWPEQISRLLDPIVENHADLVQGSRYLGPSSDRGDMPAYRKLATRIHPLLFSIILGTSLTDSTNGFRALRTAVLADPELDIDQSWLDEYELEPYLLYKIVKLGYRLAEVPVSKTYPPRELGQTKMLPLIGWWSILRPIVLLGLRLKR